MRSLSHIPGLVAIVLISAFFVTDLGQFSIFQWDEARYVNNSVEMATGGHWLYFTMDGAIDTWNFKPPLVLWMQAFSMKIFGFNEWAVRFPSLLASIGIAVLLYWFGAFALRSTAMGTVSVLFFGASCGFISPHIGRTADLDAVLAFFTTWYILYFLKYLLNGHEGRYFFARLALLVILAFFCKGIQGLLPLPYLAVIGLIHGNWKKVYGQPSLYVYAVLALGICILYYVLREWNYPGYWELVKKSEFNRFSGKGVEWHIRPFDFYWENFFTQKRYFFLIYWLPLTLSVFFTNRETAVKRAYSYITFIAVSYFFFISFPPVKLEWYDALLYPLFALMFGIATVSVAKHLVKQELGQWLAGVGAAILLCLPHYRQIWKNVRYSEGNDLALNPEKRAGVLMRRLQRERPDIREYTVLFDLKKPEHADQIKFYKKIYEHTAGARITITDNPNDLTPETIVLPSEERWRDSLRDGKMVRWKDGKMVGW